MLMGPSFPGLNALSSVAATPSYSVLVSSSATFVLRTQSRHTDTAFTNRLNQLVINVQTI
jgi:hypothetical protein